MAIRSTINLEIFGTRLFTFWTHGNDTGFHLGVRWEDHDTHLTVYQRNGVLNCHITDSGNRVWEKKAAVKDLERLSELFMRKYLGRWKRRERIYPLSPAHLEAWQRFSVAHEGDQEIDFGEYLRVVLPGLLCARDEADTLGFLVRNEPVFGLQRRRFQWYFVIAEPGGPAARIPLDLTRSPLRRFPTVEGMIRYMRYLEKKAFFKEWIVSIESDMIQRIVGELELLNVRTWEGEEASRTRYRGSPKLAASGDSRG